MSMPFQRRHALRTAFDLTVHSQELRNRALPVRIPTSCPRRVSG